MDCTFTHLSYSETGYFSTIVSEYVRGSDALRPFYKHPPTREGLAAALAVRKNFATDRELLTSQLKEQYRDTPLAGKLDENIALLGQANTFTVCTAHQPAIFTGNLFFIYKILHAVRLAEYLAMEFPGHHFVPVYYMGSEDADLDELGHVFLNGEKLEWQARQKGAIGRMHTRGLDKLLERIQGELSVQPHGEELLSMLRDCYLGDTDIQTATLKLVNHLFGEYGLVVVIPDSAAFKRALIPVFEDELFNQRSVALVEETNTALQAQFKVQAHPRDINLFYLQGDIRARITREGQQWQVVDTGIVFDEASLRAELQDHPERFSPNVILRGLMQETILPNIAFIGGGGELAYWMQLRAVFGQYQVPYPVLVVRNSFMIVEKRYRDLMKKLRISITDIFRGENELLTAMVKRESDKQLTLADEISDATQYYEQLKTVAASVDETLSGHVAALQTRAIRPLQELEKKILRAEKRKFDTERRQLSQLKQALFPNNNLQERVDNFMPFYAEWGSDFIDMVYRHSLALEQRFGVLLTE